MKRFAWPCALAVLAAALIFFNLPAPAASPAAAEQAALAPTASPAAEPDTAASAPDLPTAAAEEGMEAEKPDDAVRYVSDAPLGKAVGEQLPDFSLDVLGGGTFTLSEHRGQVVVLNFWATWCAPCVKELPHFDALREAHPDDAQVLAVHSDFITDDVAAFLTERDFGLYFAVDGSGEVCRLCGVSTMLPHTVVLNARGEIIYTQTGSVTLEALEELVALAKASVEE